MDLDLIGSEQEGQGKAKLPRQLKDTVHVLLADARLDLVGGGVMGWWDGGMVGW